MLRLETETGWWLVTHPDHARLAGAFAERWGNERFLPPEPRAHVLKGIARHDDGWAARDAAPQITRQGKPSAFSVELVGKYSAFEEIDLADYLAVRDRAVRLIADGGSLRRGAHLHAHLQLADATTPTARRSRRRNCRCSIGFSSSRRNFSKRFETDSCGSAVRARAEERSRDSRSFPAAAGDGQSFVAHVRGLFRGRLTCCIRCRCVAAGTPASRCGRWARANSSLDPYPFSEPSLSFQFPARHVKGKLFSSPPTCGRSSPQPRWRPCR